MKSVTFMSGILTFYLKGKVEISRNSLFLSIPNTILGVIPFGSEKHSLYVHQISTHDQSFGLKFKQFIVGVLTALMGLFYFTALVQAEGPKPLTSVIAVSGLGIVHIALAVIIVITAFYYRINIYTTGSLTYSLNILIFEKHKAEQVSALINEIIETRLNDTNARMVAEAQTMTQGEILSANNMDLAQQIAAAIKEANK